MMKKFLFATLAFTTLQAVAQREELMPFGDMDQWVTRRVKESFVIGGKEKVLYEIAPTETIVSTDAYKNRGGSPWASSNVMAKVAGVVKTNTSVFRERRGEGYCARLETRMESVKVLGVVNITVLAAGSIYAGEMIEPITGTKNPQKWVKSGIPFTQRPTAIKFDYKVRMSGAKNRIYCNGFSPQSEVEGKDFPAAILLLQKRWEENGKIYAKRVGTMVVRYDKTTDTWQTGTYPIMYGDITKNPEYVEDRMKIQVEERYSVNSKGNSVPIYEVGWASPDETPTHMVLQFTSSHGGAYVGSPGNILWIDNVRLIY